MPRPPTGRRQLGANPYVSKELQQLCHLRRKIYGTPYGKTLDHIFLLAKDSKNYHNTQKKDK